MFALGRSVHVSHVIRKELGVARIFPQCLMLVFSMVLHFRMQSHVLPLLFLLFQLVLASLLSTSPDSPLDSIHQSNLPLSSVPSWDANISPVNSAMLSPLSLIVNVSVSTLRNVPKGARNSWSGLLADVFSLVHSNPFSYEAWRNLFMPPKCILFSSFRRASSHWRESVRSVKQIIRRWYAGDLVGLWSEVQIEEARLNSCMKKKNSSLRSENASSSY